MIRLRISDIYDNQLTFIMAEYRPKSMKAFWWFEKDSIAGMARPGFNYFRWFDLPFEEASMLGWLGQHSSGKVDLESFRHHLGTYVPRIYHFHQLDHVSGPEAIKIFKTTDGVAQVLKSLNDRTQLLENFEISGDELQIKMNPKLLEQDIAFIKSQGITKVISLTEKQHSKDILQDHFSLHHIAIPDLGAPEVEQAHEITEILKEALTNKEKVVVHCLAGLGRTSTMILAAHVLMGKDFEELKAQIQRQNPSFGLTDIQTNFLKSLISK